MKKDTHANEKSRIPPAAGLAPAAAVEATGIHRAVPATLLTAVQADLAQRKGLTTSEVSVRLAQPVTWRDGSMGCPDKGMAYTQALMPGYRVILQAAGADYAYHAGQRGNFRFCEHPASEGIAPPGAGNAALE